MNIPEKFQPYFLGVQDRHDAKTYWIGKVNRGPVKDAKVKAIEVVEGFVYVVFEDGQVKAFSVLYAEMIFDQRESMADTARATMNNARPVNSPGVSGTAGKDGRDEPKGAPQSPPSPQSSQKDMRQKASPGK